MSQQESAPLNPGWPESRHLSLDNLPADRLNAPHPARHHCQLIKPSLFYLWLFPLSGLVADANSPVDPIAIINELVVNRIPFECGSRQSR